MFSNFPPHHNQHPYMITVRTELIIKLLDDVMKTEYSNETDPILILDFGKEIDISFQTK